MLGGSLCSNRDLLLPVLRSSHPLILDGNVLSDCLPGTQAPLHLASLRHPWVYRPSALGSMALAFSSAARS